MALDARNFMYFMFLCWPNLEGYDTKPAGAAQAIVVGVEKQTPPDFLLPAAFIGHNWGANSVVAGKAPLFV